MSGTGPSTLNYNAPNLNIPYTMPSSVPAALQPIIKPIYIAFQNIIQTLIYYCGIAPRPPAAILSSGNDPTAILANNVHRFYVQALAAIPEGAAINLYASNSTLFVQLANATTGAAPCDGFCSQSGGIPSGGVGEVILNDGVNNSLTGLVPGTRYYLSTTAGLYTATPPTASGNLQQMLGIAINTTTLRFWTGTQIQH